MVIVPLNAVPRQVVRATLGGQACRFNVYQQLYGLFIDVYVNDLPIILGVICFNLNLIVRSKYLAFIGDLSFVDQQGMADPDYTGLGARFQLAYLDNNDIVVINPD